MNDRLKFRAFCKKSGIFYEYDLIDIFYCDPIGDEDEYIWQQCTGLKDKDGKLIYEGDIIATLNTKGEIYAKEDLKFGIGDACEDYSCKYVGFYTKDTFLLSCLIMGDIVVIGNIYEGEL